MNIAGWSSSVARRAHNPKVVGSNPAPATNKNSVFKPFLGRHWVFSFAQKWGSARYLLAIGSKLQKNKNNQSYLSQCFLAFGRRKYGFIGFLVFGLRNGFVVWLQKTTHLVLFGFSKD